jgi:hypothetical protein
VIRKNLLRRSILLKQSFQDRCDDCGFSSGNRLISQGKPRVIVYDLKHIHLLVDDLKRTGEINRQKQIRCSFPSSAIADSKGLSLRVISLRR